MSVAASNAILSSMHLTVLQNAIATANLYVCHPNTNHTCLNNSTAAEHHRTSVGTHFAYPREEGQAESAWLQLW